MKKITEITRKGRTFVVCKDEHGYWAFEDCCISPEGTITREYNGLSGLLHEDLSQTLRAVCEKVDIDELIAAGVDPLEACVRVCTRTAAQAPAGK